MKSKYLSITFVLILVASLVGGLSGCGCEKATYSEDQQTAIDQYGPPDYFELLLEPETKDRLEIWIYVTSIGGKLAWINGELEEGLSQKIDPQEIVAYVNEPELFPESGSAPQSPRIPSPNPPKGIEPGQFGFDTTRESLVQRFGDPSLAEKPNTYPGTSVEWLMFADDGVLATLFNGDVVSIYTIDPMPDWNGKSIVGNYPPAATTENSNERENKPPEETTRIPATTPASSDVNSGTFHLSSDWQDVTSYFDSFETLWTFTGTVEYYMAFMDGGSIESCHAPDDTSVDFDVLYDAEQCIADGVPPTMIEQIANGRFFKVTITPSSSGEYPITIWTVGAPSYAIIRGK